MRVGEEECYVEVAEVGKVYRNGTAEAIEAVSSVSFNVARGEFVAFSARRVPAASDWTGVRARVSEFDKYLS